MINKIRYFLAAIILLAAVNARATEGMWIPLLLEKYNIEDMQKRGFKLSAEDIYSVNQASMKDAVMIFGGGCTAEFVSPKGLILTNHHCGYSAIQSHSSPENDYLTDGFWAMNSQGELLNPNLTVTLLVRMEDVTDAALQGVNENMSEEERDRIIKKNSEKIIEKTTADTHYQAKVKPFFHGNQYFVFVEEVFKDVRLAGAPPSAIGKFGGDTDNWMWPRHTGDFSVFRVYADKNNQPAEYSEDNVPYQPKKYFSVSTQGYEKDDFTMVFGYPGSTQQYIPSYAVNLTQNIINPQRINIRRHIIDIMAADMEADPKVRIQYASKYAGISNGWKKWKGENRGLKRLNTIEKKQAYEKEISKWINADETRKKEYGHILSDYKNIYQDIEPYKVAEEYFYECIWRTESIRMAARAATLARSGKSYEQKEVDALKKHAESFFKDYNLETDKKIFKTLLKLYLNNVERQFIPDFMEFESAMTELGFTRENVLDLYTEYYFKETIFLNQDRWMQYLENYNGQSDAIKNSPAYIFYKNFVNLYLTLIRPQAMAFEKQFDRLNRKYMRARMEFQKDKVFYPDANFTLRVTYGKVNDYFPRDGVYYKHYTTLEGIMEKDNPDIYDYNVPKKLKDLYRNKDYGNYGKKGKMHVCFIASNHTSGGNSGSPIINDQGHLIGINFDRNWEGTMSDIHYDPEQCRNISVDIRYVLFIIDKFAGADYLLEEMDIIR